MKCPACTHVESKVVDSRVSNTNDVTRRRRECEKCSFRFTTYERVEEVFPLLIKRDGRREPYDRQKALSGVRRACVKRAVSNEALEEMMTSVERSLMDLNEKEISSSVVGEKLLAHLKSLDEIAYVRFASVYRSFRDVKEFKEALDSIVVESPPPPPPSRSVLPQAIEGTQ